MTGGNAVRGGKKSDAADRDRGAIPGFLLSRHAGTKTGKKRSYYTEAGNEIAGTEAGMMSKCEKCDGLSNHFFICECERPHIAEIKVWRPKDSDRVEVYAVMGNKAGRVYQSYRPIMRGDRRKWDALFSKFPDMLAVMNGETRENMRPMPRDPAGMVAWHPGGSAIPFVFRRGTILDLIAVQSRIYAALNG